MKVVMKVTLTRGNKVYPKGLVMSEKQAKQRGVSPSYYEVINNRGGAGVTLTDNQFRFIINRYQQGERRNSIIASFRQEFPESDVPNSSLNRYAAMCEVLDDNHPESTDMVVSQRLEALWFELVLA